MRNYSQMGHIQFIQEILDEIGLEIDHWDCLNDKGPCVHAWGNLLEIVKSGVFDQDLFDGITLKDPNLSDSRLLNMARSVLNKIIAPWGTVETVNWSCMRDLGISFSYHCCLRYSVEQLEETMREQWTPNQLRKYYCGFDPHDDDQSDTDHVKAEVKPLYLVMGKSGTGKDTLVNRLCYAYDMTAVKSYTTRPPRHGDKNHLFISEEEFEKKREHMLTCVEFDGHKYGVTAEQLKDADFYIVDPVGRKQLEESYHDRPLKTVFLYAPLEVRVERMIERALEEPETDSFSEEALVKRLLMDVTTFGDDSLVYPFRSLRPFDYIIEASYQRKHLNHIVDKYATAEEVLEALQDWYFE